jgi:hypothetical protein
MEQNRADLKLCAAEAGRLHAIEGDIVPSVLQFNARQENQTTMLISFGFGTDPKAPLITIYGQPDGETIAIWHRDGTVTLPDPSRLDEAANIFIDSVRRIIQQGEWHNSYLVREKGVNRYLSYSTGEEQWVDRVELATHFVRREDAFGFQAGWQNREIVPVSQAHVF